MGTGKSSVGRLVAELLRFRFVDTDELIEGRTGKTITRIFAEEGEAAFRALEQQLIAEQASEKGLVISVGGGAVVNPDNLASLKSHALVVCLWASPKAIWARVGHQDHRPLLQGPDPLARIQELLDQRAPFYKQADVLLSSEFRSAREVAQQVVHQFRLALPPIRL